MGLTFLAIAIANPARSEDFHTERLVQSAVTVRWGGFGLQNSL